MARRFNLNPRIRHLMMQGFLVLALACAVGLAALVTRRVRMGMRVELGEARTFGRLVVKLPAKWVVTSSAVERGDSVDAEEPPGGESPGRRLRILRQRTDGLISPAEHLLRSGRVKAESLKSMLDRREGFERGNVEVGGWPGRMLTTLTSPRAGVVHKDLIACAVLPESQALIVHLEGVGPIDASDRELLRQMAENVSLAFVNAAPAAKGEAIRLVDDVVVRPPRGYVAVPCDDPNQHQRQLLIERSSGAWVAIDLAACVFFEGDRDEALLAMLAARDPDWRSGPVKRLDAKTLRVDRMEAAGSAVQFPARAYLRRHEDGRGLLVMMRGGMGDGRMFDSAWEAIAGGVKFEGKKDFSAILTNGAEAATALGKRGLGELLGGAGSQTWYMWDHGENADKEQWSEATWQVSRRVEDATSNAAADVTTVGGRRTSRPSDVYSTGTQFAQEWSAAGDLSKYTITTHREVRRGAGAIPRPTLEQRVTVDGGKMSLYSAGGPGQVEMAVPGQFVPGAVLPLVLRELAEKPGLFKTESFAGVETVAGPGLLTLMVTRLDNAPLKQDERGLPMDCVSVSVSGTGVVSRWYFTSDRHELRFVDFAGGMKAQVEK